jgi:uncharacterized membrane protein
MLDFFVQLFESHYYSALHHALIIIHVAGALIALVVAPVAMIATKGGRTHIFWGRVYFWAMFVTNIFALALLYWRFNTFLFGVVVTSFYSSLTAYRAIYRKRGQVTPYDWSITTAALITGIALVAWGALTGLSVTAQYMPSGGNMGIVGVILPIIFGIAIANDAWTDVKMYRSPSPDRRWWWYYHMERMLGSYIGLSTALMVQQVGPRLPESLAWLAWVAPSVVGVPLIAMWITHYRRKFTSAARPLPTQPTLTNS